MAKLRVYKSTQSNIQYVFGTKEIAGKAAPFLAGEYRTKNELEIAELDKEIAAGHPHIFIDPERTEIDEEDVDPVVALKKKHYAEFLAQQERAMNASKNVSKSDNVGGEGTGIGTTAGHQSAAASSNQGAVPAGAAGAGVGAKLANLLHAGAK